MDTPLWLQIVAKLGLMENFILKKLFSNDIIELSSDITLNYIITDRDIALDKEEYFKLEKIEKLESLGVLIAGVAHDFNNLLTGIMGNISLATDRMKTDHTTLKILNSAEKACFYAKNLTSQLLAVSKGGVPLKKVYSFVNVIEDTTLFCLRGSNIRYEFTHDEELFPLDLDEGQLSQITSNMVINAKQAMIDGGVIVISAQNCKLQEKEIHNLQAGNYVKLSFSDQGVGIPSCNIARIFETYFTTKKAGSGLGLSICSSIVRHYNGWIVVDSIEGKGTTFDIYIPAILKKDYDEKDEEITDKSFHYGKGRILVMDDDKVVCEVLHNMLEVLRYEPVITNDGDKALEVYTNALRENPFRVVIINLTIRGGVGGVETMKKLLEIDPEVKAIVSSGYSDSHIMKNYKKYGFVRRLSKPYRIFELSQVLKKTLHQE